MVVMHQQIHKWVSSWGARATLNCGMSSFTQGVGGRQVRASSVVRDGGPGAGVEGFAGRPGLPRQTKGAFGRW